MEASTPEKNTANNIIFCDLQLINWLHEILFFIWQKD